KRSTSFPDEGGFPVFLRIPTHPGPPISDFNRKIGLRKKPNRPTRNVGEEGRSDMPNATRSDLVSLEAIVGQLQDLDREGVFSLIDQAVRDGATLESLVTGVLAPALVDLGRRWVADEVGAAEVRAAGALARAGLLRAG